INCRRLSWVGRQLTGAADMSKSVACLRTEALDRSASRMLEPHANYAEIYASFRWSIPDTFNIGYAVCDSWAELQPDRPAIYDYRAEGQPDILTFGELRRRSDALAAAFQAKGIERGDRIAILLPQCFET